MHVDELRLGPAHDKREMVSLLHAAVERGVTLSTPLKPTVPSRTRNSSAGRSAPLREKVVIATKFGFGSTRSSARARLDSRPEPIPSVGAMLGRLNVATIDLLFQHRVDPDVPIEDVAGTVKELIQARHGEALRVVRARPADGPSCTRGPACRGRSERYSLWWGQHEVCSLPHWRSSASGSFR